MILANTRHRLSRDDAQLALRVLSQSTGEPLESLERRLSDDGIDAVLDDPRLPAALVQQRQGARASLPLFAYVVVRHALLGRGETDRGLADYVSAVLEHFGVRDRSHRIGDSDDERYETLAQLAEDLDDRDPRRSFLVRTHLGNYALWLSGLYPDWIEYRRWQRGGPDLEYYEEMGRRGYQLAADHRLAEQHGLTPLFASAAERFGVLRLALNAVSDWMLFPNVQTPDRLMRQVRDEAHWRLSQ